MASGEAAQEARAALKPTPLPQRDRPPPSISSMRRTSQARARTPHSTAPYAHSPFCISQRHAQIMGVGPPRWAPFRDHFVTIMSRGHEMVVTWSRNGGHAHEHDTALLAVILFVCIGWRLPTVRMSSHRCDLTHSTLQGSWAKSDGGRNSGSDSGGVSAAGPTQPRTPAAPGGGSGAWEDRHRCGRSQPPSEEREPAVGCWHDGG